MKMTMMTLLVAMLCASALCIEPFVTTSRVAQINQEATTWTAAPNPYFLDRTEVEVRRLMGVDKIEATLPLRSRFSDEEVATLPAAFSWVDRGIVGDVRNQGDCGSCWAFGGVEALSDRMRIHGKNVNASAIDPVACDDGWFDGNNGCEGGSPSNLWSYLSSSGAVSTSCGPYLTPSGPIPTCPPEKQPCLNFVPTPTCNKTCVDGKSWSESKIFAASAYSVSSDQGQIQAEIFKHGPVEGAFTVYSDFPAYKTGVYQKTPSATVLGGHAIEIVGWGSEGSTPYWLVRNSWTTTWGDQGYFKILRGQDECGIESGIVAGMPKL